MYILPQEIETWYIIPAIRKEMSRCLTKDFGMSYDKVGAVLGVSKAAVSQYSKGKRAGKIKLPEAVEPKIMASCKNLMNKKSDSVREISKILDFIKSKKLTCCICSKLKDGVLDDCKEFKFKDGRYC